MSDPAPSSSSTSLKRKAAESLSKGIPPKSNPTSIKKAKTSASTRTGGRVGREGAGFSFPSSTIIRLTNVRYSMDDVELLGGPEYFRVVSFLGESLAKVVEVEKVEKVVLGDGRKKCRYDTVGDVNSAMKILAVPAADEEYSTLRMEWNLACNMSETCQSIRWKHLKHPVPFANIKAIAHLEYASAGDAISRDGGELGWIDAGYQCLLMDKGIPLPIALASPSTSEDQKDRLVTNAFHTLRIFHALKRAHKDVKFENFLVVLEHDEDGGERMTEEVKLIDCGGSEDLDAPWLDHEGRMAVLPEGTPQYMSAEIVTLYIQKYYQDALDAERLDGIWSDSDKDKMTVFLQSCRSEKVRTTSDYWSLGISIIRAFDEDYFQKHTLKKADLDAITQPLKSGTPPSYATLINQMNALSPKFTAFYDKRDYLLRVDISGKQISEGIVNDRYRHILSELLVRPEGGCLHYRAVPEKETKESRAAMLYNFKELIDLPKMAASSSSLSASAEQPARPSTAMDRPMPPPTTSIAMAKGKGKAETLPVQMKHDTVGDEIIGVVDLKAGRMVFTRILDTSGGKWLRRTYHCGLEGCIRPRSGKAFVGLSPNDIIAHLRKADQDGQPNKSRCSYFSREGAVDRMRFVIQTADGTPVGTEWVDESEVLTTSTRRSTREGRH